MIEGELRFVPSDFNLKVVKIPDYTGIFTLLQPNTRFFILLKKQDFIN
jgi:hypothetical protein